MKVLRKLMLSFLVLALLILIGTIGSESYAYSNNSNSVNKGRYYCPVDGEFYTIAGSHSHKGYVRKAPVVSRPATEVVNKGRHYCYAHDVIYDPTKESHKGHVVRAPVVSRPAYTAPVGQERQQLRRPRYERDVRISDRYHGRYRVSPVDINIWITRYPYPTRYRYLASPYGQYYGHNTSTLYNLGGHNVLRDWFGK